LTPVEIGFGGNADDDRFYRQACFGRSATRGIGRAIAEAFIEAGARVALHGSYNESVDRLANELGKSNSVVTAPGSIATIDGCRRVVEAALTGLCGLDVLINNAGRWNFATVEVADGVACRFGGVRPYFICPGVVNGIACGRRVAMLYWPGRHFLCRHCYRLGHASQIEDPWERALRRANKIQQRLGGEPGMAALLPARPKGMWRRTYGRLSELAFEAEIIADDAFVLRAERLLARINTRNRKRSLRL
jgi:hypothetical protein